MAASRVAARSGLPPAHLAHPPLHPLWQKSISLPTISSPLLLLWPQEIHSVQIILFVRFYNLKSDPRWPSMATGVSQAPTGTDHGKPSICRLLQEGQVSSWRC